MSKNSPVEATGGDRNASGAGAVVQARSECVQTPQKRRPAGSQSAPQHTSAELQTLIAEDCRRVLSAHPVRHHRPRSSIHRATMGSEPVESSDERRARLRALRAAQELSNSDAPDLLNAPTAPSDGNGNGQHQHQDHDGDGK